MPYSMRRWSVCTVTVVALSALASGCVIMKRDLKLPGGDGAAILLVSGAMPPPISDVGRHSWFAVRRKGDSKFRRIEFGGGPSDPFGDFGGGDVRLHAVWTGTQAEKGIACIIENAEKPMRHIRKEYWPWPGPNSNTFIDILLRKCNLHADLPATAIGADYRGKLGASWTSGGTGFQIESTIVGIKLGLTEGIQIHILGLAIGIDFWPPAIIVPVGPGRIGFDDR